MKTEVKTPKEFFDDVLPKKFDASKAAGYEAIIQVDITGPNGGNWTVAIKDQKMDIKQGTHPAPTLSIKMADTDYVDMVNGKLGGERAFMTGKLRLKGNIILGMKLKEIGFMQ